MKLQQAGLEDTDQSCWIRSPTCFKLRSEREYSHNKVLIRNKDKDCGVKLVKAAKEGGATALVRSVKIPSWKFLRHHR